MNHSVIAVLYIPNIHKWLRLVDLHLTYRTILVVSQIVKNARSAN